MYSIAYILLHLNMNSSYVSVGSVGCSLRARDTKIWEGISLIKSRPAQFSVRVRPVAAAETLYTNIYIFTNTSFRFKCVRPTHLGSYVFTYNICYV